ncbi:MAG: undecaprenyl-diphosphate phosphatase [Gammaproteobacteria bacterium]|nr:undecaprenyl-diphosphate phosphatase [Gammaproteobacteria bacterium]
MDLLHVVWLALLQGLTEFLPISSSAHLILAPRLLGWPDQGIAFDVAVHLGTLIAVVTYFRHHIVAMFKAWLNSLLGKGMSQPALMAWGIVIATIPAGLAGLLFKDIIETELRSPVMIGLASIFFGLILWWVDLVARQQRHDKDFGWKDFILVGLAQALALIPGTSRSGITMTAGLMLGFTRDAAARFSFLMSIPIIVASGLGVTKELFETSETIDYTAMGLGVFIAAVSAFICIHYFLAFIQKIGMLPFVIYRVLLGVMLLVLFW